MKIMSKQWREIAEKEAAYASVMINYLHWLEPGTYTAKDVHRAILNRYGHNYLSIRSKLSKGRRINIQTTDHQLSFYTFDVFYELHRAERFARLSRKEAKRWTVQNRGIMVAETTLSFPDKRTMEKLRREFTSLLGHDTKLNFNLKSNVIITNPVGDTTLALTVDDYNWSEMPDSAIELSPDFVSHLYGPCTLRLYHNPFSDKHRVMITNADGWSVGIDCEKDPTVKPSAV